MIKKSDNIFFIFTTNRFRICYHKHLVVTRSDLIHNYNFRSITCFVIGRYDEVSLVQFSDTVENMSDACRFVFAAPVFVGITVGTVSEDVLPHGVPPDSRPHCSVPRRDLVWSRLAPEVDGQSGFQREGCRKFY